MKKHVTVTLIDELSDKINIQHNRVRSLIRNYDDSKLYDLIYLKGLLKQIDRDMDFIYHLGFIAGDIQYINHEYLKLKIRYNRREKIIKTL